MKKWLIIIVSILAVAGIGLVIYLNTSKGKKMIYAKTISAKTGISWQKYMTMEEGYLKGRATAMKAGAETFSYNGSQYNTASGKKII